MRLISTEGSFQHITDLQSDQQDFAAWIEQMNFSSKREFRLEQDKIQLKAFLEELSPTTKRKSKNCLVSKFFDDVQYCMHNALSNSDTAREILTPLDLRDRKCRYIAGWHI